MRRGALFALPNRSQKSSLSRNTLAFRIREHCPHPTAEMDNTFQHDPQPNTVHADGRRPAHTPYPHTLTFDTFVKRHVPALKEAAEKNLPFPFPPRARFMGTLKLHGYNATIVSESPKKKKKEKKASPVRVDSDATYRPPPVI